MKIRVNAALLLLLSLYAAPLRAMQVEDEQVTPEMREAVDRYILQYELSRNIASSHVYCVSVLTKVEQLLTEGADPNGTMVKDSFNGIDDISWASSAVIVYAKNNDYTEAYSILTRRLAGHLNDEHPPLLMHPLGRGHHEPIGLLLKYGANPDCVYQGKSALYKATTCSYYPVIQRLLAYGADPNRLIDHRYPSVDTLEGRHPSPLDTAFHKVATIIGDVNGISRNVAKLLLAHGAKAHGPAYKDLSYPELCGRIWKAGDPNLSDSEAHEKQRLFTLDHWNIRNPAQFILDRRMGLVKKPRCKCWEVEV